LPRNIYESLDHAFAGNFVCDKNLGDSVEEKCLGVFKAGTRYSNGSRAQLFCGKGKNLVRIKMGTKFYWLIRK